MTSTRFDRRRFERAWHRVPPTVTSLPDPRTPAGQSPVKSDGGNAARRPGALMYDGRMGRRRFAAAPLGIALLALLGSGGAAANGVFPSAGQLLVDPSEPAHIVIRTTFGVLSTRDGGDPWDWTCEKGVGYGSGFHPPVAITGDGSVLTGLPDGLAVAHGDGCSWARVAALEGAYVVDVSAERGAPSHAVAITSAGAAGGGALWQSLDDAVTWTLAGQLPAGFRAATVDVAPSDPERVYASGLTGEAGKLKGALAVSSNRGKDWALFAVPQSTGDSPPYLGAIDPASADRVYLRLDGMPGRLFVHDQATGTFTEVLVGTGLLRGFALSPDGATVLVGDSVAGVSRSATSPFAFEHVSDIDARCLTWTADGVYACASEPPDVFTIGLSLDAGESFAPLLHQPCVRGPLACADDTSVGAVCAAEWPAVAKQIDWQSCHAGGSGGSGGEGGGGGSGGAQTSGGGAAGSGGEGRAGCACGTAAAPSGGEPGLLLVVVVGMVASCRRRGRKQ